jgi:ketosteroid isomerase-like protein
LIILEIIFFVASSGLLFNEKFRNNKVLVVLAGLVALLSTYTLAAQFKLVPAFWEIGAKPAIVQPNGPTTGGGTVPSGTTPDTGGSATTQPGYGPSTPAPDSISETEAQSVLNRYLAAWQNGDVDTQDNLLARDFFYADATKRQDRDTYMAQKRRLAANYLSGGGSITVTATDIRFAAAADGATITYTQRYEAPGHYWSIGTNVFTLRREDGSIKIASERFDKISSGE